MPEHPEFSSSARDTIEASIYRLWEVIHQLSCQVPRTGSRFRVSLFGSARMPEGSPLYEQALQLAARLSADGCDIVTGGGPGLMEAANQGENLGDPENRTTSYGLSVTLPFEEDPNPFVEKIFHHQTFFSRLHHFVHLSNAYVVMPGGIGTTLELLIAWQLLQVRHIVGSPLILFGTMWTGLVDWMRESMLQFTPPLVNPEDLLLPQPAASVDEVMALLAPAREAWAKGGLRTPCGD